MIERRIVEFDMWKKSLEDIVGTLSFTEIEEIGRIRARVINFLEPTPEPDHRVLMELGLFFDCGTQVKSEGFTTDLDRIVEKPAYNFFLQDTSRWLAACGIVFDKKTRTFSIHT
jgi:hypothetical protein